MSIPVTYRALPKAAPAVVSNPHPAGVVTDLAHSTSTQSEHYLILPYPSGTTAQRPKDQNGGMTLLPSFYYDTSLNQLIGFDGANWRSMATGAVV